MSDAGGAAPTGCYKCGRPGHWSRDCPSSNPNPNPNHDSATLNSFNKSATATTNSNGGTFQPKLIVPKPKKVPRVRPKITPDLLLSDQGLGYILRYFPKNFKYRGRGHEATDLGNLLRMYAEWHSQLIPYFPFDQFIHKVEDAGSRRVKMCIAELKERVANGGDMKLKDPEQENETLPDGEDVVNVNEPGDDQDDFLFNNNEADEMHEDIFNEVYDKTTEQDSSNPTQDGNSSVPDGLNGTSTQPDKLPDGGDRSSSVAPVTEEQKALMEAKRLKALEKAAARSRLLKSS